MSKYSSEEEIIKDKYLFISYSHEEKSQIRTTVEWLIGEGVKLWYDTNLHNGDNWIEVAKNKLVHENCIGTIFFNSVNSYISDPVAKERKISLDKKDKWAEEGKTFHIFVVNIGKPSTMRLVKQVFDSLPDNDRVIRSALTTEKLDIILKLFSDSHIYSFMDPDEPDAFRVTFLNDLINRAPEAVKKADVTLEEMGKLSQNAGISFKLGRYKVGDGQETLEWQYLNHKDNEGIFLLKQVLDERLGVGIDKWLNEDFKNGAFSKDEIGYLIGKVRLLSVKETIDVNQRLLQTERIWWLSDVDGALQKVVREDGSVYHKGSINTKIRRCVRPVITVDMNVAKDLMTK